ncbi:hypothetical protein Vretimale_670 [Volvox reticuliferus]|uniref:Uncharacterized protein n=1 Tax=Volvox reticuliferus TaxID=1737510 RepID=A0A8J4D2N2_9CHLO|nr:hypothetical protein Vretifemale_2315 [Volvox reticuliferus]GIL94476.1 hypothetical protein Vretimale_670 [Volvox reticuliferus]
MPWLKAATTGEGEVKPSGPGAAGSVPRDAGRAGGESGGSSGAAANGVSTPQDCLGCRVTGCLFGVGGAAYLGSALLQDPPPRGAHRYAMIAAAGTMFMFGMYRALV